MSKTLTRRRLSALLADEHGMTLTAAEAVVDSVIDGITDALKEHRRVSFRGLGAFYVHERTSSRAYIDVNTGERRVAPPSVYVRFTPSKALQQRMRRDYEGHEL